MQDIRDNHRVLERFDALAHRLWEVVQHHFPEEIGSIIAHLRYLNFDFHPFVVVFDCADGKRRNGLYGLFRYYRYHPGQNFAPHVDHTVFDENDEDCQSRFTFLIYLNEDYEYAILPWSLQYPLSEIHSLSNPFCTSLVAEIQDFQILWTQKRIEAKSFRRKALRWHFATRIFMRAWQLKQV